MHYEGIHEVNIITCENHKRKQKAASESLCGPRTMIIHKTNTWQLSQSNNVCSVQTEVPCGLCDQIEYLETNIALSMAQAQTGKHGSKLTLTLTHMHTLTLTHKNHLKTPLRQSIDNCCAFGLSSVTNIKHMRSVKEEYI